MGYDVDSCARSRSASIFASSELAFITLSGADDPSWRCFLPGRDCDPLQCFLPSPFSASSLSSLLPSMPASSASYCLASVSIAESGKRQLSSRANSSAWSSALGFAIHGSSKLGRRSNAHQAQERSLENSLEYLEHSADESISIATTTQRQEKRSSSGDYSQSLKAGSLKTSKHLLAGALSACISRTLVAPLERLKLEYIVRGATSDAMDVVRTILASEGVQGFWKGNLVNLIRTAPFKSINFYAYDTIRKRITTVTGRKDVTPLEKLAAGAAAGIFATIVCFPMDTIRTRLVAQGGDALGGISGCFRHIITSQGFTSLYAGIVPAIVSMAPAGAVFYGVYDILKTNYLASPAGQEEQRRRMSGSKGSDQMELGPLRTLLYGAIAGACAETMTYPLEVVRRHLQLQSAASRLGLMPTIQGLVNRGGVGALYAGIFPSTLQVLPSAALSYFVYEWMKVTMKVS
ncbi:probable mitochondrial adenine nucleotide transporter BTL3 [Selaginella moellendorffii]|nr:probable mitochondrial adenine nucleotide transporter BTL3 [Selaginella moellendorffii]|eukprot:XP_002969484.2 probable mitochondrial adenine nucleotide transporter BTL3 [Selaginella moellendorffii]